MKAGFIRQYFLIFSAIVAAAGSVVLFQNCSNDAGFNANPSVAAPFVNTNPPRIGGNEDVVIRLNEYPTDQTLDGGNAVVDFVVTPGTNPDGTPRVDAQGNPLTITDVKCFLNGQEIECDPTDRITLDIEELGLGTQTFTIEGTNSEGETATETITFTVFESIVPANKTITVNSIDDNADIIIVVDNSGSMEYEQQSMAQRIGNFMDKFKEANYRISVTTTAALGDPNDPGDINQPSAAFTDGKFIQFPNGSYCIDNSIPLATAQQYLGQTVQRAEEGNGWERGIYMAVRSFERSQNNGSPEANCLRNGVAKHVILISDEDETVASEDGNNTPLIEANKSEPQYIADLAKQLFGDVVFKFHSIIVDPLDPTNGPACLASHGAKYGDTYAALSVLTGGVRGSVCAVDYADQLEQIGQSISDSAKVYPLDCVAVSNGANAGSVTQNGQPIGIPYQFNGSNIEFAQELPIGVYEINYFCFQ